MCYVDVRFEVQVFERGAWRLGAWWQWWWCNQVWGGGGGVKQSAMVCQSFPSFPMAMHINELNDLSAQPAGQLISYIQHWHHAKVERSIRRNHLSVQQESAKLRSPDIIKLTCHASTIDAFAWWRMVSGVDPFFIFAYSSQSLVVSMLPASCCIYIVYLQCSKDQYIFQDFLRSLTFSAKSARFLRPCDLRRQVQLPYHLELDCSEGMDFPMIKGANLRYSAPWFNGKRWI